jgi:serine/threonine-protein kinase
VKKGITVTLTVSDGPGQGIVPDVAGDGRRAAYKALRAAGFKVTEREQNDDTVKKDHVISTSPPVNSQFDRGQTVISVVSLGPSKVAVPQLVGSTQDEAQAAADDAGLKLKVTEQDSTDKDPGTVLAQDQAEGTMVAKGTVIGITVAKKPDATAVPDVTGKTASDAVTDLSGAGFKVVQKQQDVATPDQDGVVLKQDPAAPKKLKPGQTVTITIGSFNPDLNPEPGTTGTTPTTTGTTTTGTTPTTTGTTP